MDGFLSKWQVYNGKFKTLKEVEDLLESGNNVEVCINSYALKVLLLLRRRNKNPRVIHRKYT
jgi:hypothetical protein